MRGVAARSDQHRARSDNAELDARQIFENYYGRELGADEFEEIRLNLLRFFSILRRWDSRESSSAADTIDVELLPDE